LAWRLAWRHHRWPWHPWPLLHLVRNQRHGPLVRETRTVLAASHSKKWVDEGGEWW
jgi:hypothetical protein